MIEETIEETVSEVIPAVQTVATVNGKCTWCNTPMQVEPNRAWTYCSENCQSMHQARI